MVLSGWPGRGGGSPLCKPSMCRPKGYIDFAHFGLELGIVYKGNTVVY